MGGDFNEDISSRKDTRRECSLNQIISENRLTTSQTGKTYVGPNGVDTSTIDYVFYGEDLQHRVKEIRIMDDIQSNVSDHYPLLLIVELEVNWVPETNLTMPQSSRIKWDKVDKEAYNATVAESLSTLKTDISSLGVLDSEIRRLNEILIGSAEDHAPKKLNRLRKAKLKVCSPEIKQAIKEKKKAFWRWMEGNRPGDKGDVLVITRSSPQNTSASYVGWKQPVSVNSCARKY